MTALPTTREGCLLFLLMSIVAALTFVRSVPLPEAPRLGFRGVQRARTLKEGGFFALFEPAIRFGAGLLAPLPLGRLRCAQEDRLVRADDWLGLEPDEFFSLSVWSALGLGAAIFGLSAAVEVVILERPLELSWVLGPLGGVLGLLLPTVQVLEEIKKRSKVITRGLPHAIEVAAMCMGAGLDFPGALRQLCRNSQKERDPLKRELEVILEQLELGQTRRAALKHFAWRVQSEAVRDFVNSVVQAEEKGNPLAKVIQVQGRLLNMRRSVAAEEAAARAGVLMVIPMMLLICCILVLLLGPFIVTGVGY